MIILVSSISGTFEKLPLGESKKVALVTNAKDKKKGASFDMYIDLFKTKKHKVDLIDLRDYNEESLYEKLSKYDIIFVAGGNSFYLLEIMRKSGFDKILDKLLKKGLVYLGESAGACVMGNSIEPIGLMDDPSLSDLVDFKGLNYVEYVFLPHYKNEKYSVSIEKILEKYKDKFKMERFEDSEGLIIENGSIRRIK